MTSTDLDIAVACRPIPLQSALRFAGNGRDVVFRQVPDELPAASAL